MMYPLVFANRFNIPPAAKNVGGTWLVDCPYDDYALDKNPVLDYQASEKQQREFGGRGGRKPVRLPAMLSLAELDRLTAEVMAGEGFNRVRDAALILLALATGLRTEELTALLIHKVSLAEASLSVIGKGNKERAVWMDCALCEIAW